MAVFGVDYATPSQYAARTSLQLLGGEDDVLNRQDEIAANFYFVDHNSSTSERVRQCFLNFFVTTLSRYKFFVNNETQRIDEERFIESLNLGHRQREYVRMIITSQMFEIFLSQQDVSSIRRRRLFDEHIIKHRGGAIEVSGGAFGGNNKNNNKTKANANTNTRTTTNKTTVSSSSEATTTSKFDEFINRRKYSHVAAATATATATATNNGKNSTTINNKSNTKSTSKLSTTTTPLLDSKQWRKPTIIVPQQPCVVGLKEGRVHCHDRRFPDHLVEEECITNNTVSSWKVFWDGTFCSAFFSCTY
jgi:hypothetical protein